MTYTEIYIDDVSIDLGAGVINCPITYSLIDIKNLNNRAGSRTKTVTVPRTAKNDRIFGVAYDINATNRFDKYTPHRVRIEEQSEVIFDGLCRLARVTPSKIEFFCYAELSAFKGISGTLTLNDLRLNDLDHTYDTTIYDTWSGTYPTYVNPDYIYPVIDYGTFWTRTLGTPEEIDINAVDLFPAVYLRRIVEQIFLDNGYTLVSTFFDDPQMSNLVIPFTNEAFIHSEGYFVETVGFEGYTSSNSPFGIRLSIGEQNIPIVTEVFDPLDQWHQFDREYTAESNQRVNVTFSGFIDFSGTFNVAPYFNMIIQKYDSVLMAWENLSVNNNYWSNNNVRQFFNYDVNTTLVTGDKIRILIEKLQTTVIAQNILVYAENFKITPQPVSGNEIQEGEMVQLAPNLPNIKQIDLIAWCYKMFNWVIDIDAKQGVVYLESYTPYYQDGEVIDMSRKLNLSIEPEVEYDDPTFARKYDFEYTLDEADYYLGLQNGIDQAQSSENFGDGKLYLTEQGDSQLIGKVGFSPTVIAKSFSDVLEIPTMINLDGGTVDAPEFSTKHEPRILIYAGLVEVDTLSGGAFTEVETDDGSYGSIPFCYFQKRIYGADAPDLFTQQLSFNINSTDAVTVGAAVWSPNTLVDTFYRSAILDLSTSASVTAYFNLSAADLASLDFSVKWFVDYFEAQFKLGKIIDYQPGRLAPTKVELIKVGAYINPRQLDTIT